MTCAHIQQPSLLRYKCLVMTYPAKLPKCLSCGQDSLQEVDGRSTFSTPVNGTEVITHSRVDSTSRPARVVAFRCERAQCRDEHSFWFVEGATEWTPVTATGAAG
jgi:hypothetical protein